jgi:CCR4-NOT transcriptional regulation complex NOT5 subunit
MFSFFSLQEFVAKSDWNEIKDYKEIIEKRNILAHCMEQSSSAEKIIILKTKKDGSTEPIIFTPYDFIELRKKIKYFRDKFENLNK